MTKIITHFYPEIWKLDINTCRWCVHLCFLLQVLCCGNSRLPVPVHVSIFSQVKTSPHAVTFHMHNHIPTPQLPFQTVCQAYSEHFKMYEMLQFIKHWQQHERPGSMHACMHQSGAQVRKQKFTEHRIRAQVRGPQLGRFASSTTHGELPRWGSLHNLVKNHQKKAPPILPPVTHHSHLLSLCITTLISSKTHLLLMYRRVGSLLLLCTQTPSFSPLRKNSSTIDKDSRQLDLPLNFTNQPLPSQKKKKTRSHTNEPNPYHRHTPPPTGSLRACSPLFMYHHPPSKLQQK
jgi:hypothetical protein